MKGRVGAPTVIDTTTVRRTVKAKHQGWCKRCRNTIYPGEWIVSGKFDTHRYSCPNPEEAAEAYARRLTQAVSKRRKKG